MTTNLKKKNISKVSIEETNNLKTTSDLYMDMNSNRNNDSSQRDINIHDTERKKKEYAEHIKEYGDIYVDEIKVREAEIESKKIGLVNDILKIDGEKHGKVNQLYNQSYEDILKLHSSIKNKATWFEKLINIFIG